MEPFSFGTDDYFGVRVFPFFLFPFLLLANQDTETYLQTLNKSEYEAVMRYRDDFGSIREMKRFVNGLHK